MARYCSVCGWVRKHRQVQSGGIAVFQCEFCHAEVESQKQPPKVLPVILMLLVSAAFAYTFTDSYQLRSERASTALGRK